MELTRADSGIRASDRTIHRIAERPAVASRLRRALSASALADLLLESMSDDHRSVIRAAEEIGLPHQVQLRLDEARAHVAARFAEEIGIPLLGTLDEISALWRYGPVWQISMKGPSRSLPGGGSIVFTSTPIAEVRGKIPDSVIFAIQESVHVFDGLFYLEPIYSRKDQLVSTIAALRASSAAQPIDPIVIGTLGTPVSSDAGGPLAGRFLFNIAHWD